MLLYPTFLKSLGIRISGKPTFISPSASFDASDYSLIFIGDKCVISGGVRLLTHDYSVSRVAIAKGVNLKKEFRVIKPVIVGNNSFVGTRSIIMPGVRIGDNAIVGAGSVVTHDVADNNIVGGNPARKISTIDEFWEKMSQQKEHQFYEV
jgi:maltose O-acetyltransferase